MEIHKESASTQDSCTVSQAASSDYPFVHCAFERQVEQTPDAIGVVCGETQLTYQEINQQANRLAHELRRLGVAPEVLVGVYLERSIELVIGLLGILKAGGAFVILESSHPRTRLDFILQDTRLSLLVSVQSLLATLPTYSGQRLLLDVRPLLPSERFHNPPTFLQSDHLAYILYTSGSTGIPKGVEVEHHSLTNYLSWAAEAYDSIHSGSFPLYSSLAFDLTLTSLFLPLLTGHRLLIQPAHLQGAELVISLARNHDFQSAKFTPAHLGLLLQDAKWNGPGLRGLIHVIVGGEALSPGLVKEWFTWYPQTILYNEYGPTETVVGCVVHKLTGAQMVDEQSVPIGLPIAHTSIYILDEDQHAVPAGTKGEMYIGGAGVARGYLNQPELTAERFIELPTLPGERLYKTGDLARYRPDGLIEFLGRGDYQIKIRGFRIEPGEIEAMLASHPSVEASLVLARENYAGEKRLIAYLVPVHDALEDAVPLKNQLRVYLQERLPEYMIPSTFVFLPCFPQTPHGKIDRDALPGPDEGLPLAEDIDISPFASTEHVLVSIWRTVFKLDRIDVGHNFFELGGHSLQAMQIIARIRNIFQIQLPVHVLIEMQNITSLAEYIDRQYQNQHSFSIPPLEPVLRTRELPLSFAQEGLWFLEQLMPASSQYNVPFAFQITGPLQTSALETSFAEIVRRHEILRTIYTEEAMQVITPIPRNLLSVFDLQELGEAERSVLLPVLIDQEARRPFDFSRGPMFRFSLLRLAREEQVLLLTFHHIAFDAWSTGVFFSELRHFYATASTGELETLEALPIQYADYACWQRKVLQREELKNLLTYWTQHLQGAPAFLKLPTDYPRPAVETHRGQRQVRRFPASLKNQLQHVGHQENVTFFMLLYAAFVVLLHCLSEENDLVVGVPMAGRTLLETERLIGFFINSLALRTTFPGDPGFREILAQVRETALQAYAHQDLPFDRLVEELRPRRDLSRHPLFQVVFQLLNTPAMSLEFPGLEVQSIDTAPRGAKFDLILTLIDTSAGPLEARADYSTDLFTEETVKRMLEQLQCLLENIVKEPGLPVSALKELLARKA